MKRVMIVCMCLLLLGSCYNDTALQSRISRVEGNYKAMKKCLKDAKEKGLKELEEAKSATEKLVTEYEQSLRNVKYLTDEIKRIHDIS